MFLASGATPNADQAATIAIAGWVKLFSDTGSAPIWLKLMHTISLNQNSAEPVWAFFFNVLRETQGVRSVDWLPLLQKLAQGDVVVALAWLQYLMCLCAGLGDEATGVALSVAAVAAGIPEERDNAIMQMTQVHVSLGKAETLAAWGCLIQVLRQKEWNNTSQNYSKTQSCYNRSQKSQSLMAPAQIVNGSSSLFADLGVNRNFSSCGHVEMKMDNDDHRLLQDKGNPGGLGRTLSGQVLGEIGKEFMENKRSMSMNRSNVSKPCANANKNSSANEQVPESHDCPHETKSASESSPAVHQPMAEMFLQSSKLKLAGILRGCSEHNMALEKQRLASAHKSAEMLSDPPTTAAVNSGGYRLAGFLRDPSGHTLAGVIRNSFDQRKDFSNNSSRIEEERSRTADAQQKANSRLQLQMNDSAGNTCMETFPGEVTGRKEAIPVSTIKDKQPEMHSVGIQTYPGNFSYCGATNRVVQHDGDTCYKRSFEAMEDPCHNDDVLGSDVFDVMEENVPKSFLNALASHSDDLTPVQTVDNCNYSAMSFRTLAEEMNETERHGFVYAHNSGGMIQVALETTTSSCECAGISSADDCQIHAANIKVPISGGTLRTT